MPLLSGFPPSVNSNSHPRNGVTDSIKAIIDNLNSASRDPNTQVVIAPPALYLPLARQLADPSIGVAAQNVYDKPNGAFTGEISVEQLRDIRVDWVIIGHSERRVLLREDDDVGLLLLRNARVGGADQFSLVRFPQGQGGD